ncbi:FBX6-like protein [Mya arenaria]|uniref:FBX6-like protein n=1 Tax=Mya arenaria TaxID=6604 RepID=A0ABY7FIC7_MYAAR|nr:FBX6-like protein [Mya arenaria]
MGVSNSGFSGNNSGRIASNGDKSGRMMEWEVVGNGGDGWSVETEPIGSDPVSDFNNECKGSVGCWATSYRECAKYQVVDLMAAGCCKYVLDHVRPAIHVSEYSARRDCGAVYKMTVVLMPEKTEEFWTASTENTNTTYSFDDTLLAGSGDWFQAKYTFKDYPMGIRYVGFYHNGKDTKFWAGNFGAKMTLASVILDFKHVAGPAESRDIDV